MNGDHPSDPSPEYPMGIVPKEEWPTMPELPDNPTATELARAYGTMAAAYHEVCRQMYEELQGIRAEHTLSREEISKELGVLRMQLDRVPKRDDQ
jgi:hypothetical protein